MQDSLINAVNSLPDILYNDVDVDTMSFRQLYETADMDYISEDYASTIYIILKGG